jgi:hypothetical protein
MPEISRFFGIIISIYYTDHYPPHSHERYGKDKASIRIEDFAILEGYLPPRALGLVMEWAGIHKNELQIDWELAKNQKPPIPIEPLK